MGTYRAGRYVPFSIGPVFKGWVMQVWDQVLVTEGDDANRAGVVVAELPKDSSSVKLDGDEEPKTFKNAVLRFLGR